MSGMRHVYIGPDMCWRPVCHSKHREGVVCKRDHGVPITALWSGYADWEYFGDFKIAVKKARKDYRLAVARWERRRLRLVMAVNRAAPEFRSYAQSLIARHDSNRPVYEFKMPSEADPIEPLQEIA